MIRKSEDKKISKDTQLRQFREKTNDLEHSKYKNEKNIREVSESVFNSEDNQHIVEKFFEITKLPEEVITNIFSKLDIQNLGRVAQVNKLLNRISADNQVWINEYNKMVPKSIENQEHISYKDAVRHAPLELAQMHIDSSIISRGNFGEKEKLFPEDLKNLLNDPDITKDEKNKAIRDYLNSPADVYGHGILGNIADNTYGTHYTFELLLELGATFDYHAYSCELPGNWFGGTLEQIHTTLKEKKINPDTVKIRKGYTAIEAACNRGDVVRTRILLQHGATLSPKAKELLEERFEYKINSLKGEILAQENEQLMNALNEISLSFQNGTLEETFSDLVKRILISFPDLKDKIVKGINDLTVENIIDQEMNVLLKTAYDARVDEFMTFVQLTRIVFEELTLHLQIPETNEKLTHIYAEKESIINLSCDYKVPSLNGAETDQQIVDIMYSMPWKMRREVLAAIRQQPNYTAIAPLLISPIFSTETDNKHLNLQGQEVAEYENFQAGNKILAQATKNYLQNLGPQNMITIEVKAASSM